MLATLRRIAAFALILALSTSAAALALTSGGVTGYVTDQNGAPVPGARVALTSASFNTTTTSDAKGFFAFDGIPADTYSLSVQKSGFAPHSIAGLTVLQDSIVRENVQITTSLTTIATVKARPATSLVQPGQTADEYVVTQQSMKNITGLPMTIEQSQVLNSLPGFTPTSGGAPSIRGGAINDLGYEMNGVDIKEPVLGLFTNNGALAGVQQLTVDTGSFDVASGNTNEGTINVITRQGSYPGFIDAAFFKDLGYFYNGVSAEAGGGSPDNRFTWYVAYSGVRDANVVGDGQFHPFAVGSTSNVQVNESVANVFYRWGHDNSNQLQFFGETGYNVYDYNWLLDPSKTPYTSSNHLVWASLANGTCDLYGTTPMNCGQLVANTLPPFPGQQANEQFTNYPDNENNYHSVQKIEFHHQFSPSSYFSLQLSKAFEYDNTDAPWAGGAFNEYYLHNASTNYGFTATYDNQIDAHHDITVGAATLTEIPGYNAQQESLAANTYFNDWCYVKAIALTPQFGCSGTGTPLDQFPNVEYVRDDMMHLNSAYIRDRWQPNSRWFFNLGLRWDNQKMNIPADAAEEGSLLNYDGGTGDYIQTLGPTIDSKVTNPSVVNPRAFATYTMGRSDVLRFGWGRYVDFAPELQVETKVVLPTSLRNCDIASGCFAPLPGYGTTNEVENLYQQSLYDFNTYFSSQYQPTQPQYVSDFEFSWEHDWSHGWQTKITPYLRKGTNYVVGSQAIVKTLASGAPLYGPYTYSNLGVNQSAGVEFALQKSAQFGWSGWLNATFDNTMANYNSDYFPGVSFASIALNHFYHVSYAAPISGSLGIDLNTRSGFHIWANVPFETGYWYGVGKKTFIYENFYPDGSEAPLGGPGTIIKPVQVPNTNYINGAYGYYTVDPDNPGTYGHPNIIGSKGTPEGDDAGSLRAPPRAFLNVTFAQDFGPNNVDQIGIRFGNALGNYSMPVPVTNAWYHNNGFGAYNPNSGVNGNASLEPFQYNLGPGPYEAEAVGPERQIMLYFQVKL